MLIIRAMHTHHTAGTDMDATDTTVKFVKTVNLQDDQKLVS